MQSLTVVKNYNLDLTVQYTVHLIVPYDYNMSRNFNINKKISEKKFNRLSKFCFHII